MQYCKTVTLRTRPIKNGMLSFYLDFYPGYRDKVTMKTTRHESLGIYIYADPKNKREKEFNEIMTEKAEAIRCRRFESVVTFLMNLFPITNSVPSCYTVSEVIDTNQIIVDSIFPLHCHHPTNWLMINE
jgi:hypothetical protein